MSIPVTLLSSRTHRETHIKVSKPIMDATLLQSWPYEQAHMANDDMCYDLVGDKLVKKEDAIKAGWRIGENVKVCGPRNVVNDVFKWTSETRIPPNPPFSTYLLLQSRLYPVDRRDEVEGVVKKVLSSPTCRLDYIGPFSGGMSLHGLTTDVLVSGIHKYVRRGWYAKAMWCLVERDLFNDATRCVPKSFSTRMYNRVGPIMCCEDVGMGSPFMPELVDELQGAIREGTPPERRLAYFQLLHNMIRSKKSRELSHIRAVYSTIPDLLPSLMAEFPEVYEKETYPSTLPDDAQGLISMFKKMWDKDQDVCYVPFFKLYEMNEHKSVMVLLKWIAEKEERPRHKKLYTILTSWYKTMKVKERWMFACHLIHVSLKGYRERQDKKGREDQWERPVRYDIYWLANLENEETMKLDAFCIDIHTKVGKAAGMCKTDFATEGSLVYNEHPNTNQLYKRIYIRSKEVSVPKREKKQAMPEKVKGKSKDTEGNTKSYPVLYKSLEKYPVLTENEEKAIWLLPRGQILTSAHKKYTFIGVDWVWKGPWEVNNPKTLAKLERIARRVVCGRDIFKDPNVSYYSFVWSEDKSRIWMKSKCLSDWPSSEWKISIKSGQLEKDPIRVVDRDSMDIQQLNTQLPDRQEKILFTGSYPLIWSYVNMALMQTGDMGPWNCLIAGGRPYIVDYDDDSGRKGFVGPNALFARSIATKVAWMKVMLDIYKDSIISYLDSITEKVGKAVTLFPEATATLEQIKEWAHTI